MGVATQRKGHGETGVKQRGSGECSASDDIYIKQRRILARAECMNRITLAVVSMANKRKGD